MTTVSDPQGRPTVIDLIKGVKERVFPVGRLDFQSEGLLLLTNDGELAFKVSHPKHGSVKTYHVKVRGVPAGAHHREALSAASRIDGKRTSPCEITRLRTTGRGEDEGNSWFEVKLREGRTQQIRKMFSAVGHPVVEASPRRDRSGSRRASSKPGQWRDLDAARSEDARATERQPKPKLAARRARPAAARSPPQEAVRQLARPRRRDQAPRAREGAGIASPLRREPSRGTRRG